MKAEFKHIIISLLYQTVPDKFFSKINFYYLHLRKGVLPKRLRLNSPGTFNEKIISLKLKNRFDDGHILVDKYAVKNYIKNLLGEKYIIPTLGIYNDPKEIDFNQLPDKYVLKANQGSGWNVVINNKEQVNEHKTRKLFERWLNRDYSIYGREWQYKNVNRKILAEKFLEHNSTIPLLDYKFFCFNGKPKFIQVDIDRDTNHTRNFYDLHWNLQPFTLLYPKSLREVKKPEKLSEMISVVEKISTALENKMPFVRVDLYFHQEKIYFGEITFHPEGGNAPFMPKDFDWKLGEILKL